MDTLDDKLDVKRQRTKVPIHNNKRLPSQRPNLNVLLHANHDNQTELNDLIRNCLLKNR